MREPHKTAVQANKHMTLNSELQMYAVTCLLIGCIHIKCLRHASCFGCTEDIQFVTIILSLAHSFMALSHQIRIGIVIMFFVSRNIVKACAEANKTLLITPTCTSTKWFVVIEIPSNGVRVATLRNCLKFVHVTFFKYRTVFFFDSARNFFLGGGGGVCVAPGD